MSYIPVPGLFRARMASTANLTLSGNQTVDTIVGAAGNVVLAKNQTTASQNGPYVMAAGAWARLPAADNAAELVPGSLVIVSEGSANVAGSVFELTTAAPLVVGTTNLTFSLVAAPGSTGVALSSTNPADVGTAAAIGVGTTAARADHVHDFNATDTATVTWDYTTPGVIKANAVGGGSAPSPATTVTEVNPTANVVGTGVLYARDDHAHFHGELPGGELHDLVNEGESGLPGFMSLADKSKLDGIADNATNTPIEGDEVPEEIVDSGGSPGVATTSASAWDHVHAHGLRGAGTDGSPLHTLATNEAPGFMASTDHAALALWEIEKCRYFFLDNDSGDDAHVGFLDRTPGHSFGGGEAAAVAAAKIKTVERLLEILPRNGNGRMCKILFKNRAAGQTYLMADASTRASLDLTGITGYRWIGRCGSTDLTNETNDMTQAGGVLAGGGGPNGNLSYTVAGLSGNTLTIGAGAFDSDATDAGWRVRFTGDVTPAIENLCIPIYRITSSTQMKLAIDGVTAAAGDTFFIEKVGVNFENVYDIASATTMSTADATAVEMVSPMVGIGSQTSATADSGVFRMGCLGKTTYAFCSSRDSGEAHLPRLISSPDAGHIVLAYSYVDEIGQTWQAGPCRVDGDVALQAQTLEVQAAGLYCSTTDTSTIVSLKAATFTMGEGTQFKQAFELELTGAGQNHLGEGDSAVPVRIGATSAIGAGGLLLMGSSSLRIDGVVFDTAETANNYEFIVRSSNKALAPNVAFANITWRTGLTDMKGLRLVDCYQGRFFVDDATIDSRSTITVAAAGSDIIAVGVTEFAHTNLIDLRGNNVIGNGGALVSACSVVLNGGDPIDSGTAVRYNGQITYPGIEPAIADALNSGMVGITIGDIATDGIGFIATNGVAWSKDGGGWSAGEVIYVSADTAGELTNASPTVGVGRYKTRAGRAYYSSQVQLNPDCVAVLADAGP